MKVVHIVTVKELNKDGEAFYSTLDRNDANKFANYYRRNKYKYPSVVQSTVLVPNN